MPCTILRLVQVVLVLLATSTGGSAMAQSVAFFYGPRIPEELLVAYDWLVVEPGQGHAVERARGQAELIAYLSVGEVSDASVEHGRIQPAWVLGRNEIWHSSVMNLASPEFQRDLIDRRFEALWYQGYRSFFLDTLDSYQLITKDVKVHQQQAAALVTIIERMHARHPEVKLLVNRGFDVLDQIAEHVAGVVAESLFSTFNASTGRYEPTPEASRQWLQQRLEEVRTRYELPVVVIDYASIADREAARAEARKIAALGFMPWVSERSLMSVGVGLAEIVPRRVLLLTNDASGGEGKRLLAPVLEHLGYVLEHHDLSTGLPDWAPGSLAGIITWLTDGGVPSGYGGVLRAQLQSGVHVVMFGAPGVALPSEDATELGFVDAPELKQPGSTPLRIQTRDELAQFEAEPSLSPLGIQPARVEGPEVVPHLTFSTGSGATVQALVSTRWGAWAASHFLAPAGLNGEQAWSIDPFTLLTSALRLSAFPIPDVTTENGGRLAMFVVRGQGLSAPTRLRGRPQTASVLRKLLARFPVPHALDLEATAENSVSPADRAAALGLTDGTLVRAERLPPGRSLLTAQRPSMTQLAPLAEPSADELRVSVPMAGDYHYIPAGIDEAYPYRAAAQTIALTDAPRRLSPVALDYHASSLASDGGHAAIASLYEQVLSRGALPVRLDAYAARVRDFRAQVVTRQLDGSFVLLGGRSLKTVRLPDELGPLDLARSPGIASVHESAQGRYVTFLPDGPRKLVFRPKGEASGAAVPHLTRANAEVRRLSVQPAAGDGVALQLELLGFLDLQFELAGLPREAPCTLRAGSKQLKATTDREGKVRFALRGVKAGRLSVRCAQAGEAR